jgi:regulator of protease activity HflC (stomatin/prohibitin superfamily)
MEVGEMIAQDPAVPGQRPTERTVAERESRSAPGITVLLLGLGVVLLAIALIVVGVQQASGSGRVVVIVLGVLLAIGAHLAFSGLTSVVAGEARVVQLFGQYRGTVRTPGLRWINPFTNRRRVSVRIRNLETSMAKVNDADGNPIEIAAVVVWQVRDTAQALYSVDDFVHFVAIQTETAVRHIASSYPYDNRGSGALSLRDNAEEITGRLSAEIGERVASAGVLIVESRLTRLSYAPEIAQAMLRQQQASAVVGARQRIVEGAVGMVQMALQKLDEENVVELDEERKATMVSNLLVVLCSEQATQPIVNTGTLYQ